MSIKRMTAIWNNAADIGNPTELLLLLALADHANEAGVCWPSIDRLAKRTCTSKRHVQRLIAKLVADGRIEADRRGGPRRATFYRLLFPGQKDDAYVALSISKGDTDDAGTVTYATERATPMSRKGDMGVTPTIIDPPVKHQEEPPIGVGGLAEGVPWESGEGITLYAAHDLDAASVPDTILEAWCWPLSPITRQALANAVRTYSAHEVLTVIEIMRASRKKIARPAAYLKRVLQRRQSTANYPEIAYEPQATRPHPAPVSPEVMAARQVLIGQFGRDAEAWTVEVKDGVVTIDAGHMGQWLELRAKHSLERRLCTDMHRPVTVSIVQPQRRSSGV